MPNVQKTTKVENLKEKLEKAKSVVFVEYSGLDANRLNELRKEIRSEGAELSIAKNTLMKIALEEKKTVKEKSALEKLTEELTGQIMTLFSYEDAVSPLKKLVEFAKEHEIPTLKAGVFEGNVIGKAKIKELSALPSREELLARVVGGLNAPLTGFVNVLGGGQRKLVYALSAISKQKEEKK